MDEVISYIISFLLRGDSSYAKRVGYTADKTLFSSFSLVIIPSNFFSPSVYGSISSLPSENVSTIDNIPFLFGESKIERLIHENGETIILHSDLIASTYFLISRYEEMLCSDNQLDAHGRFRGHSSWLYRAAYMDRPIVDQYSFLLKKYLDEQSTSEQSTSEQTTSEQTTSEQSTETQSIWKQGLRNIYLTHDVDNPYLYHSNRGLVRSILDKRGLFSSLKSRYGAFSDDPYYTFSLILKTDQKLKKALSNSCQNTVVKDIYFLKVAGDTNYDKPHYKLSSPLLKDLRSLLMKNGSEVGIHLSYTAGGKSELIEKEKTIIEKAYKEKVRLNRHHFLRFINIKDIHTLVKAGITDDFTMGYADISGFRLGTSRSVRAIDPFNITLTKLYYHPLICMDSSLFSPKYMNLDYDSAWKYLKKLIDRAYIVGGDMNLLWHNTAFVDPTKYITPFSTDFIPASLYEQACDYMAQINGANISHEALEGPNSSQTKLNILLLCDIFPPAFAPRMGYLIKNLHEMGHRVTIITEKVKDSASFDFLSQDSVHYINKEVKNLNIIRTLLSRLGKNSKSSLILKLTHSVCSNEKFDVVLCSTYRTFPLPQAAKIAETYKLPLVADLRDIIEQYPGTEFISRKLPSLAGMEIVLASLWGKAQIKKRNGALYAASAITTISPWHKDFLQEIVDKKTSKKIPVSLIYNGFDHNEYYPTEVQNHKFKIIYTGRLLSSALRDPSLLFKAIESSRLKGEPWANEVEIDWYCDLSSWEIIQEQAKIYGPSLLEKGMSFKGYVAAKELPEKLNESAVILILTNKSGNDGPKGIMTTKLFESLAVEKPILCVRSDESYIAQLLQESNQGCAAKTEEDVVNFLSLCYSQWKSKSYTHCKSDPDFLKPFRRDFQAVQFEEILKDKAAFARKSAEITSSMLLEGSTNSAPIIQIVAFNIPFPANYGGVIDVFYKLKALKEAGVRIYLHCFCYGREYPDELSKYCEKVYYYPRQTGIKSQLSFLPYNVYGRRSKTLLERLNSVKAPILFEGLHSCYYISHYLLKDHYKIYRESNIEHHYYYYLGQAEKNYIKKLFFFIEAFKFRTYQSCLKHAQCMLAVSKSDKDYLSSHFPHSNVEWMPSFQPYTFSAHTESNIATPYILYHGNLSVAENEKAALYLSSEVFSHLDGVRCIIAGLNPSEMLKNELSKTPNIELVESPSDEEMEQYVQNASIHLLYTAQATGLKLKLLHCLCSNAHIVANSLMLRGSGLDTACHICDTAKSMIDSCKMLISTPPTANEMEVRSKVFNNCCSNEKSAQIIVNKIQSSTKKC